MQRILVVGPCGAGKSTLATDLAARTGLPLHHLDRMAWLPGWVELDDAALHARIDAVVAQDRWLLDGTYGSTLDRRLPRADTVVYLDYPIRLCLWRIARRLRHWRGKTRPDMGQGCPERFDAEFLWYVVRWNAGPRVRLHRRLAGHWDKVIRLRTPAQAQEWLDSLPAA